MKPVSKDIENNIRKYLEDGLSVRAAARNSGVSRSVASRIATKYYPDRSTKIEGRPSKLTKREKGFCVQKITTGRKESATDVQRALGNKVGTSASVSTVRRALVECGIGTFVKPKKPLLSQKNVKARLEWAKAHVDWTIDDWKLAVWSDETKIARFGSDGKRYCWKRESESAKPKHGGGNIKLWSCVTYYGVGCVTKIDNILDKELYLQILQEDLMATINDYDEINIKEMIFRHDNDPKHTAGDVKRWLECQEFRTIDWPAQSPDLNLIENMWAQLKMRLYRDYECPPTSMNEHWKRIWKTWYKFTQDGCRKVIESMPKRCQEVIKDNGYGIDY